VEIINIKIRRACTHHEGGWKYLKSSVYTKKLLVSAIAVIIELTLLGCATVTKMNNSEMLSDSAPTIVIIGGAGSTPEQMKALQDALTGSIVITPEKYYPIDPAIDSLFWQIRAAGVHGRIAAVGWSWGGYLARGLDAQYEGLVVAIVTIATPVDIRFVPTELGDPFHPDDNNSKTPLYVIACAFQGTEKKWWMRTNDDSDGIADVSSVILCGRKPKGSVIIKGRYSAHWDIAQNPEVIKQVKTWLSPSIRHKEEIMVTSKTKK